MKKTYCSFGIALCASLLLIVSACGGSSGGGSGGTGDDPNLSAFDFPDVGVCDTGSTDVDDATFKAALATLTEFTFVHFPYSSDADIPFICGKQGVWDPSDPKAFSAFTADIPITTATTNLIQGALGNVLICNTGFVFADPDSAGLHDATTWRGELLYEVGGRIYRVRVRFTVSGADAGKTLASLGITPADLKLTDNAGNELTTLGNVLALFATNPGSVSVNVVSNGTTHINALGRVICWEDVTP